MATNKLVKQKIFIPVFGKDATHWITEGNFKPIPVKEQELYCFSDSELEKLIIKTWQHAWGVEDEGGINLEEYIKQLKESNQ